MKKIFAYFDEVVRELKNVVWPTPEKVMSNTRVVLISTVILAVFFGAVDLLLTTVFFKVF